MFNIQMTRRTAVKSWGAAVIGATLSSNPLLAQKKPGETRVLFLVGDYWHNPITQEKKLACRPLSHRVAPYVRPGDTVRNTGSARHD